MKSQPFTILEMTLLSKILYLIIVLLVATPAYATHYNVILFAGQSNCAGADAICDGTCTASRCTTTGTQDLNGLGTQQTADTSSLIAYSKGAGTDCGSDNVDVYGWGDIRGHDGTTYSYATNTSGQQVKQCGSEIGFVRSLYDAGWRNIAIIKFSANFSSMEDNHTRWIKNNSCYDKWKTAIDARLASLVSYGGGGNTYTIRGVLWHQGIDNGVLHQSEADYETDLTQTIADIRSDYGATLPFILARSVNSTIVGTPWMTYIRTGQVDVAGGAVSYCEYVNVDDSTLVNTHHIRASSHLTIGDRFADALLPYIGNYQGMIFGSGGTLTLGAGGTLTLQ